MEWLYCSDAVFIVPNCKGLKDWGDSKGTLAEIEEAEKHHIPIFYEMFDLLKYFKLT